MKIHIVDTDRTPLMDTETYANCGKTVRFRPLQNINSGDPRLCEDCVRRHNTQPPDVYSFAVADR